MTVPSRSDEARGAAQLDDGLTGGWDMSARDGPVMATAIHDGHALRESLRTRMLLAEHERRREEDPLTGVLTSVGDTQVRVRTSRFQIDMNRPRGKAVAMQPADSWGLKVWRATPPDSEVEQSLVAYDRFYAHIRHTLDKLIERWGRVLLLDIHSYNHRRDGPQAAPASVADNPDIDLGMTTFDPACYGALAARFKAALCDAPVGGRRPDVRENVRYDDGGHFPEWVYATYGDKVCAITLEYKKVYMDEWTAQADIGVLEDFHAGLRSAVALIRPEFMSCR